MLLLCADVLMSYHVSHRAAYNIVGHLTFAASEMKGNKNIYTSPSNAPTIHTIGGC